MASKICTNCGFDITDGSNVCPKCGGRFFRMESPDLSSAPKSPASEPSPAAAKPLMPASMPSPAPARPMPAPETKPKKKSKAPKIILASAIALIVLAAAVFALAYFNVINIPFISRLNPNYGKAEQSVIPEQINKLNEAYIYMPEGFTDTLVTDEDSAVEAISEVGDCLGIENAGKELSLQTSATIDGTTYYRFDRIYKGIPVYGHTVALCADKDGNVSALTSNTFSVDALKSTTPKMSSSEVYGKARQYIAENGYTDGDTTIDITDDELVIYTGENSAPVLAYKLDASFAADGIGQYEVIVSADDGKVLLMNPTMYTESATGYLIHRRITARSTLLLRSTVSDGRKCIYQAGSKNCYLNQLTFDKNSNTLTENEAADYFSPLTDNGWERYCTVNGSEVSEESYKEFVESTMDGAKVILPHGESETNEYYVETVCPFDDMNNDIENGYTITSECNIMTLNEALDHLRSGK